MEYYYKAITNTGERTSGYVTAATKTSAKKQLLDRYSSVLELDTAEGKSVPKKRVFKVKPENVVVFFRRLATLLTAGISMADALEFLVVSDTRDDLSDAANHLAKLVQEGRSLSAAMQSPQMRKVFDPVSIGMVAMGEQTGQLARVVSKLSDLKERQYGLTRSFISALTYPAVLFCCIIALGLLFTVILGPGDDGLFAAFDADMPWPTRVVQQVSTTVRNPWLVIGGLGSVAVFVVLFLRQMKHDRIFRLRVHSLILSIPALGPLVQRIESARILYVLADGLQVGLPMASALLMSINVCGNDKIKGKIRRVHADFCEGEDLATVLRTQALFPPLVLCMFETGIESGNLDTILAKSSKGLEEDVRLALDGISQLAEPLLLIFAGAMAGFLALATLMPIINMVDTL